MVLVLILLLAILTPEAEPLRYPGISTGNRWPGPAPTSTDGVSGTSLISSLYILYDSHVYN